MIEGQLKVTAPTRELLKAKQETNYTIRLRGQLDIADGALRDIGAKCETHYTPGEDLTTIRCEEIDQDQLNTILDSLRERRLPLVEVSREMPTLADIFVGMVNGRR
jgi:hypothetical protein